MPEKTLQSFLAEATTRYQAGIEKSSATVAQLRSRFWLGKSDRERLQNFERAISTDQRTLDDLRVWQQRGSIFSQIPADQPSTVKQLAEAVVSLLQERKAVGEKICPADTNLDYQYRASYIRAHDDREFTFPNEHHTIQTLFSAQLGQLINQLQTRLFSSLKTDQLATLPQSEIQTRRQCLQACIERLKQASPADVQLLVDVLTFLDRNIEAAAPRPLPTAGVNFRLLASLDDQVQLDTTCQLFSAIARSNPPSDLVFIITANGEGPEVFLSLGCEPSYAPTLQQLILNFFPHTELAAETPAPTATTQQRARAAYRLNYPHGTLRRFTDFNPDPLAMVCTLAEGLQPAEALRIFISFHPAPTALKYAGDCEWLQAARDKKQLPAWSVAVEIEASAAHPSRATQLLITPERYLHQFSNDDLSVFQKALTSWLNEEEADFENTWKRWAKSAHGSITPKRGWLNYSKFVEESFQRKPRIEFVRSTGDQQDDFISTLSCKKLSSGPFATASSSNLEAVTTDLVAHLPQQLWQRSYLGTDELASLVHLPHKSLTSPLLQRANMTAKKAPDELTQAAGLLLGINEYRRQGKEVRLPHQLRSRHTYIVGASGSGKSNLLKNCIRQDIEEGRGCAVIDPHGDLVTDVLPFIPDNRLNDVILFNPSDRDWPASLNPFIATTDDNRNDVALTLKSVFIRLFNVGDEARRMLNILHFTALALLEAGSKTFLDIRRFLINPEFRSAVLETINDPTVLEYWYQEFPQNNNKTSAAAISTRLAQFALSPVTRNILGQAQQTIDLYDVMNSGKILLCPLGKIQEEERQLLGSLLVSQLQLATMRRAEMPEGQRRPFVLYIDEFQNFANDAESLEKILSEARKYNLALVLAHQFTSQLPTKLADAIVGNAYTKIIFRVGVDDASYLQKALVDYTATDLQNQEIGQAVMCAGRAQDSFSIRTQKFPDAPAVHYSQTITEHSRRLYSRPRAEVERSLRPAKPAAIVESEQAAAAAASNDSKPNLFDELLGSE